MARAVGIDFGEKRVGIASTDTLGIAVHGRGTFTPESAVTYVDELLKTEAIDVIVIGRPSQPSEAFDAALAKFIKRLAELNGCPEVVLHNEDFTSKEAASVMHQIGMGKKRRKEKGRLDELSAVLLLQDYLGHR